MAITPDGNFAYVTIYSTVSVIATASNTVVGTSRWGLPPGVAITPEKFAYVANFTSGTVSVIAKGNPPAPGQPPSYTVVATVPVGSAPCPWSSRGRPRAPKRKPRVQCSSTAQMPNGVGEMRQ